MGAAESFRNLGCPECQTTSLYSLNCLDCCRRMWANAPVHHKFLVEQHLKKYASDAIKAHIESVMTTTKRRGGTSRTGETRETVGVRDMQSAAYIKNKEALDLLLNGVHEGRVRAEVEG